MSSKLSPTGVGGGISRRRSSALANVAQKRISLTPTVNLNCLVRVFLLDGSAKLLQMYDNSTAKDVLV